MIKIMTFVAAVKDYFGLKPGQNNIDFLKEVRALDEKDRLEFASELQTHGYNILAS